MKKEKMVTFQGRQVTEGYYNAFKRGYRRPWQSNPGGEYSRAFESGQTAARQDDCMSGTF